MHIKKLCLNTAILATGTFLSQVLLALFSPWLSRIYKVEDFGQYGIYSGALGILMVGSCMRYDLIVPTFTNPRKSINAAVLSLAINCVFVITLIIILLLLKYFSGNKQLELIPWRTLWVLPIGVMVGAVNTILNALALQRRAFKFFQFSRFIQVSVSIIFQLLFEGLGSFGLIAGDTLGQVAGSLMLFGFCLRVQHYKYVSIKRMSFIAKRFKELPQYSTWDGLVNAIGSQFPSIFIASFFGPSSGGAYVMANRVVQLPFSIAGNAFNQIFTSIAEESKINGNLSIIFSTLHSKLSKIAAIPFVVVSFWGPELFCFVFGDKWRLAGEYARYMAPWMFFVLTVSPFTSIFLVYKLQSLGMWIQFYMTFLRILLLLVGYISGGVNIAILMFAIGSAVAWLGMLYWLCRVTLIPMHRILFVSLTSVTAVSAVLLPVKIAFSLKSVPETICSIILCLIVVPAVLKLNKKLNQNCDYI